MARLARPAAFAAILALALVACGDAKDTGLPSGPTPEPVAQTVVDVVDSAFKPAELEVKVGETVTWDFTGSAPHNVKFTTFEEDSHPECEADINKCSKAGEEYEFTFESAGSFPYFCVIHGTANGQGMAGTIVVA
ncbi:MAG TPA: plastocyanin/azurin family copper-binding protein [Actinomycetota bacterium]|nr:plastocyanin/azurin family copper-binding protein [Actinomycetota bacterium]